MKCQKCHETATHHITEIVEGKLLEYHVCEEHAGELEPLKGPQGQGCSKALRSYDEALEPFCDPAAQQKMAAYLLPALALALLDENAAVRILAANHMMFLEADAKSAIGALRDALNDPDDRVRTVADRAIRLINELSESDKNQG